MSPEVGDKNPTKVPPQAPGEPVRPNRRNPPSTPLTAAKLPPATPPRISPPTDVPSGRLPSPQKAREGASLAGGDTPKSDSPLPLRLRASLQHWSFASPMAQRGHPQGPNLEMGQQTPSTVAATTLNLQGKVDPSHLQDAGRGNHRRGTPTEMLSISPFHRPQDFRPRGRKSGHRPLFPQPSHTVPHLQDVHSRQTEEFSPQRRLLHFHRHLRRLPPHPHPHTLPEIPCLHSRRQVILLPSHAIWDKHRPSHFFPDRDRGSQIPPQHRYFSLGLHRRLAPLEQITKSPYTSDINHSQLPSEVGLHPQPEEIPSGALPDHHLSGISWSGTDHNLLPSSKALEKVRTMALEFLQLPSLSLKKYQRLLGSINFVAPYIKYGPLHLRQIILTSPNYKVKKTQPPSQLFLQHLRWWTQTQNLEAPVPMSIPPPNLTVWTDASKTGWGGGGYPLWVPQSAASGPTTRASST